MAEQITLTPLVNLENQTTAVNAINTNNAVITTAFTDVLSLTGVTPNAMQSQLDMNSNQIINLSAPATNDSPLRLTDLNTFIGGGTITSLPTGGSTGDALVKTSNSNYAVGWSANTADIAAGTNITLSGSNPTTVAVVSSPTFAQGLSVSGSNANQSSILRTIIGASPTSSGTSDPNNILVIGSPNVSFRIGMYFNGDVWWQPCLSTSYATNTNSVFNPNGGNVGIGVAAPSFNLQVAGTTSIGGALTYGGVTLSNAVTGTGNMVLSSSPTLVSPALGTPASGVVTNLTGTASININGTVGATTPSTGSFTTLAASSTVSGTGFSTYLASPPAIGGTAPSTGAFTTLSASSTVSGAGFSTYLASPPAIGGTAPAAGTFTTLATNVAPTTISNTSELIGSAQTINKRMPVTLGGTVYWIPCSSTSF